MANYDSLLATTNQCEALFQAHFLMNQRSTSSTSPHKSDLDQECLFLIVEIMRYAAKSGIIPTPRRSDCADLVLIHMEQDFPIRPKPGNKTAWQCIRNWIPWENCTESASTNYKTAATFIYYVLAFAEAALLRYCGDEKADFYWPEELMEATRHSDAMDYLRAIGAGYFLEQMCPLGRRFGYDVLVKCDYEVDNAIAQYAFGLGRACRVSINQTYILRQQLEERLEKEAMAIWRGLDQLPR